MKTNNRIIIAAGAVVIALGVVSCSEKNISGTWIGHAQSIDNLPAAANATTINTLDITPVDENTRQGNINISSLVSVSQAVHPLQSTLTYPYEVNIAATATISGKYIFEEDDDDDILVTFDPTTLNVEVDPNGVSFSQNLLSGIEQPTIDSLTIATVNTWKAEISRAMLLNYNKYTKISDIEVHHGNTLTCEVNDQDLTFSKVQQN